MTVSYPAPPGTFCLGCGEQVGMIRSQDNRFPEIGDLIDCDGCGALHEVIADGYVLVKDTE